MRSTELTVILKAQDKERRNVSRKGDINVKVPRHDATPTPASGLPPPLSYAETTTPELTPDNELMLDATEKLDTKDSYPRLTSYDIHARTPSGVGIVSILTPMMLHVTVPEIMSDSTIAVYSVANSLPETYIKRLPIIHKTTSTQATIAVHLTELSVYTKAMYRINIHIQGIAYSTEWFRTITKLDKIRYPHHYRAVTLASLAFAE